MLTSCSENSFQVAQATRLCRPATRRTEPTQRFEVMRMAFWQPDSAQFRSAGRRPGRASRPRHTFSKHAQSLPLLLGTLLIFIQVNASTAADLALKVADKEPPKELDASIRAKLQPNRFAKGKVPMHCKVTLRQSEPSQKISRSRALTHRKFRSSVDRRVRKCFGIECLSSWILLAIQVQRLPRY